MSEIFLWNGLAISALMLTVWLISIPLKNVSIVDLIWGLGFVLVGWVSFLRTNSDGVPFERRQILLPFLVTVWGLRLSGYLAWRNIGHGEDKRYAAMREKSDPGFWWKSLFYVFLLQGVVMWVVSWPLQSGIPKHEWDWSLWQGAGIVLWSVGLFFEAVGDWQLAKFKGRPENEGKVLDQGLWRYTRHPNYFGDFCVWWGFYLIAIGQGAAWWTAVGPILMSIFLMKFSGVGLLEKSLKVDKPEYEAYIQRTNAFFPWIPSGN
ncbi:MAG: DUF1295 domain-containing protein [Planctomycetaceae bacterium]|nr:DUF1295 domain-containing protein [Planctomycetaceae bacterium]